LHVAHLLLANHLCGLPVALLLLALHLSNQFSIHRSKIDNTVLCDVVATFTWLMLQGLRRYSLRDWLLCQCINFGNKIMIVLIRSHVTKALVDFLLKLRNFEHAMRNATLAQFLLEVILSRRATHSGRNTRPPSKRACRATPTLKPDGNIWGLRHSLLCLFSFPTSYKH
jgi:hypothetical protein